MSRKSGKRTAIDGCPGCYLDGTDRVSMIITVAHASVNNGKPKNYEKRSEKWPCSKPELNTERTAFKKAKVAELNTQGEKQREVETKRAASATTLRGGLTRFLIEAYGVTAKEAADFGDNALPQRPRDQRRHILHWCEATDSSSRLLGERDTDSITTADINFQLRRWERTTISPWTIHHRRAALSTLYDTLNGEAGYNPVRGSEWAQPKDLDARGFDYHYVGAILDQIPEFTYQQRPKKDGTPGDHGPRSKSKIILELICSTGLMCAELNRVEPRHLDLKKGTLFTWREKAGKVSGERTIKLLPEALEAFKKFDAEDMYGKVPADRTVARSFANAVVKAQAHSLATTGKRMPIPNDVRPTDFRHCFGTEYFARTGNEGATGEAMGHAPGSRQTRRYTRGAVSRVVAEQTAIVARQPLFKK